MINPRIKTIDVHELKKRRDLEPGLCLIDVREDHEYQTLHIPGAFHMPKDEISSLIAAKIPERDRAIYLHCKGGVRSLSAAESLLALGYQEVYSIDGGIMEWVQSGYPVES